MLENLADKLKEQGIPFKNCFTIDKNGFFASVDLLHETAVLVIDNISMTLDLYDFLEMAIAFQGVVPIIKEHMTELPENSGGVVN